MQFPSNENSEYKAGQILKRRIAGFCAAIMGAICILITEAIIKERDAAFDRAGAEAANLAAGFEEGVRGILDGIAGASEFLKDHIEEKEAKGETFDLTVWKSKVSELVSPTINIFVIDSDAKLRATTLAHDGGAVFYSDREYFLAHRKEPGAGLLIGHPVYGKLAKRLVIPVSRRLNTPNGRFAGVLVFTIDPRLMTALHTKVGLGRTGGLSLLFNDGVLIARYTSQQGFDAPLVGRKIVGTRALTDAQHGETGSYVKNSSLDGIRRFYSWRKVAGYPLIVLSGLGEAEALADANHEAGIVIGLGVMALGLSAIMMLMLNREISRRVQHAIALAGETDKAWKASEVKSVFLAKMSHELRTPLNAILGFAEIIRDKTFGCDVNRYADYAGNIHQSGVHLLSIVNDVLDVSKIEAGKLELLEEKIEISQIIRESLAAVERQAALGGVAVTNATPEANAFILGDRTKLKQIILNLLSNAVKFTPSDGAVNVAASATEDGGLTLMIQDTGIGMSSEELKDALELFRQVDNSLSRRFQGAGLGLPLAVQLTELHGGTLTINSAPRAGTSVAVRFPPNRITWA